VFRLRGFDIPEASRQARPMPLVNLISIEPGEQVTAVVAAPNFEKDYMVLATARGEVKKTALSEFAAVRSNGLIAMGLEPGDELVFARLAHAGGEVILVTQRGQSLRFSIDGLRSASRSSGGVRGIRLSRGDQVVAFDVVEAGKDLLVISSHGYGKRTAVEGYTAHHRGGQGVKTLNVTTKTGPVVAARMVEPGQELMVISAEGIVIRTPLNTVARHRRIARGSVSVMRLQPKDRVAAIAVLEDVEATEPAPPPGDKPGRGSRKG
jgi:DNA gyrase subunit A